MRLSLRGTGATYGPSAVGPSASSGPGGRRALGFTENQITSIDIASDDPIGGGLVAASKERRILLKAAGLWKGN
jgi:hypothetical protein